MKDKKGRAPEEDREAASGSGHPGVDRGAARAVEESVPKDESLLSAQAAGAKGEEDEARLEVALRAKEAEVGELQNRLLYLQAETENFKKRNERRYREALEFATEPLLKDLLPVLDNLERAVIHGAESGPEGLPALLEGLAAVIDQLRHVLGRHGVEPIEAEGQRFDPSLHEAMLQVPGEEDGKVGQVFESGFTLKGRLLRPAKVTVTKVASPGGDG